MGYDLIVCKTLRVKLPEIDLLQYLFILGMEFQMFTNIFFSSPKKLDANLSRRQILFIVAILPVQ